MSIEPNDGALRSEGADASNWRTPPFNRWAFHNVPEILPTAPIEAAQGGARDLPAAPVSFEGFALTLPGGSSLDFAGFLGETATDALVILHDGRLAHESYRRGNDENTPHILMSSTKAVMGLMAGILARDGELHPEDLVSTFVPAMESTGYAGATIRQLLDMRCGVILDPQQQEAYEAAAPRQSAATEAASGDLHGFLQTLTTRQNHHGGPFSYVSANTDLLGWAMERATGRTVAQLIGERLWRPMGAENHAHIIVDRQGAAWCSGGLCATARDFARLGQLLVDAGRRGGDVIVPEAWIDDLHQGGDRRAWAEGEWGAAFAAISRDMSYRAGWYSVHAEPAHVFAMGVHGQNLFVDRARGVVIAKFSSQDARIDPRAMWLTHMAAPQLTDWVLASPA